MPDKAAIHMIETELRIAAAREQRPCPDGCCPVCWHRYCRAIPQTVKGACFGCGSTPPKPLEFVEELIDPNEMIK